MTLNFFFFSEQAECNVRPVKQPSPTYSSFLSDQGDMMVAVGSMEAFAELDEHAVARAALPGTDRLVCVDGNLARTGLAAVATQCLQAGVPCEHWILKCFKLWC